MFSCMPRISRAASVKLHFIFRKNALIRTPNLQNSIFSLKHRSAMGGQIIRNSTTIASTKSYHFDREYLESLLCCLHSSEQSGFSSTPKSWETKSKPRPSEMLISHLSEAFLSHAPSRGPHLPHVQLLRFLLYSPEYQDTIHEFLRQNDILRHILYLICISNQCMSDALNLWRVSQVNYDDMVIGQSSSAAADIDIACEVIDAFSMDGLGEKTVLELERRLFQQLLEEQWKGEATHQTMEIASENHRQPLYPPPHPSDLSLAVKWLTEGGLPLSKVKPRLEICMLQLHTLIGTPHGHHYVIAVEELVNSRYARENQLLNQQQVKKAMQMLTGGDPTQDEETEAEAMVSAVGGCLVGVGGGDPIMAAKARAMELYSKYESHQYSA